MQVLDQWSSFDSLHWFASVLDRHERERERGRRELEREEEKEEERDKLSQTTALTHKRIETYQKVGEKEDTHFAK